MYKFQTVRKTDALKNHEIGKANAKTSFRMSQVLYSRTQSGQWRDLELPIALIVIILANQRKGRLWYSLTSVFYNSSKRLSLSTANELDSVLSYCRIFNRLLCRKNLTGQYGMEFRGGTVITWAEHFSTVLLKFLLRSTRHKLSVLSAPLSLEFLGWIGTIKLSHIGCTILQVYCRVFQCNILVRIEMFMEANISFGTDSAVKALR